MGLLKLLIEKINYSLIEKSCLKIMILILKMLKSESVMTGNDELYYETKHIQEYIKGKSFITFVCEFDKKLIITKLFSLAMKYLVSKSCITN